MDDGALLMILGTIIGAISIGTMYTEPIGWLTLGGGLIATGLIINLN